MHHLFTLALHNGVGRGMDLDGYLFGLRYRMLTRQVKSYRAEAIQIKAVINFASAAEQICHAPIYANVAMAFCKMVQFAYIMAEIL